MSGVLLDAAGRRRSPATMPGFHARRPPRNKGLHYPADPPTIEEIVAVIRAAGDGSQSNRCLKRPEARTVLRVDCSTRVSWVWAPGRRSYAAWAGSGRAFYAPPPPSFSLALSTIPPPPRPPSAPLMLTPAAPDIIRCAISDSSPTS
jgi:hypothetical protein